MRKNKLSSRLLSLLLVAAMLFSFAVPVHATGTGEEAETTASLSFEQVDTPVSLETLNQAEEVEETPDYADSDVVRVSIILDKSSTVEAGFSTESIAQNTAAMAYRDGLKEEQVSITSKIEAATDSELDVVWNLTLAANIISANVTYGEIEEILEVPGVKDVVVETRYEPCVASVDGADPNMATSCEMIGSSAAWAAGYTGAGSRIAVIDTGIDTDHQSFSGAGLNYSLAYRAGLEGQDVSDYLESLNLLDAAEVAAVKDQLNVSIDPEQTYVSTKIPFAYNYVDGDYDVTHDNDSQGEHGSHVEGIAAANAFIPNEDGTFSNALETVFVQGVAPDAQILTMKVFGKLGGAYDSDFMAAIEDAIILGADSINLSLGSGNPGFSRNSTAAYQGILENLTESGTVVAMAAGNSFAWPTYAKNIGYLYADDVSMDTVGSPSSYTNSLSVASVDNVGFTGNYLTVGDTPVFYLEGSGTKNLPMTSIAGEQSYIYIDGVGTTEEFAALKSVLTGKIAVCSRGTTAFYEKAKAAVANGAIATIVYNNEAGTISMNLSGYTKTAPCVSITQADGAVLKANAAPVADEEGNVLYYEGTLVVEDNVSTMTYESDYNTMSDFSNWGVPGSLELKPEITAPGGSIYSVNGAVAGGTAYETMSGTSMASPQVAGMAALVAQYIRENGLAEKTGLSARQLAQSLLMSTAVPQREEESGGQYYPVLRQGAGLANVANAVSAESYILMGEDATASYADGKVKVELGDDPERTGSYSFRFTVNNLTGETQSYTLAADFFTQDLFTYEDETYMDTWTTSIPANVTYLVDGAAFVPTAKVACDLDGDGDTDADDAQIILNYVAGLLDAIDGIADVDGDGEVTTYDAYLLLESLETKAFSIPADGSVEITVEVEIPASAKEYLDANYVTGAYVEGYVYVKPVTTLEGAVGVTHSIPVLGFYGNWTDASMFDQVSFTDYLYGDETVPYTGVVNGNNLVIKYHGDTSAYYQVGNPCIIEDSYPEGRAAINSADTIYQYYFELIRNAAALTMLVTDEDGSVLAMNPVENQAIGAFYYVNGGAWYNSSFAYTFNRKVASLGVGEGDVINVSLVAIPEYYENGTDLTAADVTELMESGALGDGAYLTTTMTVDDTAPVITGITKDILTGNLTVTASDNNYIASVQVLDIAGGLYAQELPEATEKGQITSTTIDLTNASIGAKCLVAVVDYACNETVYEVAYGGEPEDYSGGMYAFTNSNFRGSGPRWMKITEENLYYNSSSDYGGTENVSVSSINVTAADYVDGYVFMAADDGNIYVAKQGEWYATQKVGKYSNITNTIKDMAYNYADGQLYALGEENVIYTVDLTTGKLTKAFTVSTTSTNYGTLAALAIDDDGNFYSVNNTSGYAGSLYVNLYKWSNEDVVDGAVTGLAPLGSSGARIDSQYAGSLAWDHDEDVLYFANSCSTSGSVYNYLARFNLETGRAMVRSSVNSRLYIYARGLYIVPSTSQQKTVDNASRIEISQTVLNMPKGSSFALSADVLPWTLADKSVTWSTSDASVVTVENGTVSAVGTGHATVTVTTNAEPHLTAACEVTVEQVSVSFSGLVYGADGTSFWADFNSDHPADYTIVAEGSDYLAGGLWEDTVYVHDGSTMFGVDADTFAVVDYGTIASTWAYSDATAAPVTDGGAFGGLAGVCNSGTFLELIDPSSGSLRYWNLAPYFAGDPMVAIAYVGSGTYDCVEDSSFYWTEYLDCPTIYYYVLTESGELWQLMVINYTGTKSYAVLPTDLGTTGLDLVGASSSSASASMIYDNDSGYLLVSYTAGGMSTLFATDPLTYLSTNLGTFGDSCGSVVSLYQHERVTDLTVQLNQTAATIYVGNTLTLSATVKPVSFTGGVTWSSGNEAVATVNANGVVTGVAEGTVVITATSEDINSAGEKASVSCTVTVKDMASAVEALTGTVVAQVETADGTTWSSIDLNTLETTTMADSATAFTGAAYANGSIYGTDSSYTVYQVDALNGFAESKGCTFNSSNVILDGADAPKTTYTYYESGVQEAFGMPLYITKGGYLFFLKSYLDGSTYGWSGWRGASAITFMGYKEIGFNDFSFYSGRLYIYLVLYPDGTLYTVQINPIYTMPSSTGYYLRRRTYGNIGMTFDNYEALSMTYVNNGTVNGLVISDASQGTAALYFVDLNSDTLACGKIGEIPGATDICGLYDPNTTPGRIPGDADPFSIREGTDTLSSTPVSISEPLPTAIAAVEMNLGEDGAANAVTGSTNALTVAATDKGRVAEPNSTEATPADGTVTVTLTEDQDVTNGLVKVTYDPEVLTYASVGTLIANYAVNVDAENGTILFDYATATAVKANDVLATLNFTYTDSFIDTKLQVETLERNQETDLNESVSVTVTYEPGGHDYVITDSKEATCTEDGYITYTCSKCGDSYTETVEALGHDWSDWIVTTEADCFHDGVETRTCGRCGETETRTLPANSGNCPSKAFTDLDTSRWYHEGVDYVLTNGLMIGITDTVFQPNGTLTRAQMVTILYRLAGTPEVTEATPFTDVVAGSYYADAVAWAYENKIVMGMTDTLFAPSQPVTREQLVTFLYRYAEFNGVDAEPTTDLSGYPDAGSVSQYAVTAIAWAVENGIIVGIGDKLEPKGTATRAQIAVILLRCDKIFE